MCCVVIEVQSDEIIVTPSGGFLEERRKQSGSGMLLISVEKYRLVYVDRTREPYGLLVIVVKYCC